jgi:hypothetical protein
MNYLEVIVFIILGTFLILFTTLTLSDPQAPKYQNYTRAIYDGMNLRDYVVICMNNKVVNILPTGNYITVGLNWSDPRNITFWCS